MSRAFLRPARAAVVGCILVACTSATTTGCSSGEQARGECVGSGSEALRTCAAGATLEGIDVSYYQGTVDWAAVKKGGKAFAFVRVSDGTDYPDKKFATNWPAMKKAGVIRGAYQYFRPTQDVDEQVELLVARIAAAGGLAPGDLPPVLDLETSGGLAASTVITRAKSWLAKVEAKYAVKPIVYTAAFMSNVIGTSFTGYELWVANYGATCPLMPSGFTEWKFWQNSDRGSVSGVTGKVDTNLFNGTPAALTGLTIQSAVPSGGPGAVGPNLGGPGNSDSADTTADGPTPNDGSQGATIGNATPSHDGSETTAAPLDPCTSR